MTNKLLPILLIISVLFMSACNSTPVQTVEVTRLVSQAVEVTRIVLQTVVATQLVNVTTTPQPMGTPTPTLTPTPRWTPSFTETPFTFSMLTITPGLQVIENNTRPEVEKFVSAQYIRDFLVMNYGFKSFGGKVFCGYTPMGMGNDGNTIKLYMWVECAEYYLKDQELKIGTAGDISVVLFVELRHGQYKIVNFLDDGGALQYVKTNFPPEIQKLIISQDPKPLSFTNEMVAVHQKIRKEAEDFFGK